MYASRSLTKALVGMHVLVEQKICGIVAGVAVVIQEKHPQSGRFQVMPVFGAEMISVTTQLTT